MILYIHEHQTVLAPNVGSVHILAMGMNLPFFSPQSTFMLGAAVLWGFPQRGGAYPRGGSQRMSAALVPVIEAHGGRVLVRANVTQVS